MAILGNNTTPSSAYFFDDNGNSQYEVGGSTMPAGGGIATDMYVYVGGDGSTPSATFCIWNWSTGALVWSGPTITLPNNGRTVGGQSWQHVTMANVYIPAGTYGLGFWTNGNVVWTVLASGAITYQRSATSPRNFVSGGTEAPGFMSAYVVYNPGGVAYVNTGTPASPVWTQGQVQVNTGTPASPNWVGGELDVNTGTPASPIWTPAS